MHTKELDRLRKTIRARYLEAEIAALWKTVCEREAEITTLHLKHESEVKALDEALGIAMTDNAALRLEKAKEFFACAKIAGDLRREVERLRKDLEEQKIWHEYF